MFVATLLRGGSFYVISTEEHVAVMAAIRKQRITCFLMFPTVIYAFPEQLRFDETNLSGLGATLFGATPMTDTVMRKAERGVDAPGRLAVSVVLRPGMSGSAEELALSVIQTKGVPQVPERFQFVEARPLAAPGTSDKQAPRVIFT